MSASPHIKERQEQTGPLLLGPSPLRALTSADVNSARDLFGANTRAEVLNLTRPNLVQKAHKLALDAGADIIRTFTDGATPHQFDRYRMYDEAFIVNYMATELAVSSARKASGDRKVLGWVRVDGRVPGVGFPCLSGCEEAVRIMVSAQVAAGADFICLDLPHPIDRIAAAFNGARQGFGEAKRSVPVYARLAFDPAFEIGTNNTVESLGRAVALLRSVSIKGLNLVGTITPQQVGWGGPVWADRSTAGLNTTPVMIGVSTDRAEIARLRGSFAAVEKSVTPSPALANQS